MELSRTGWGWLGVGVTVAMALLMGGAFVVFDRAPDLAWAGVPMLLLGTLAMLGLGYCFSRAGADWLLSLGAVWVVVSLPLGLASGVWGGVPWLVLGLLIAGYGLWRWRQRVVWERVGRPAKATIVEAKPTGVVTNNYLLGWRARVSVAPGGGQPPFEGKLRARLPMYEKLVAGQEIDVLVDPARPGEFALDARR